MRQEQVFVVKENRRLRVALQMAQRRLHELSEDRKTARRERAELRCGVADHAKQLEALAARIESVASREEELRNMLLSAHDQLMRRANELKTSISKEILQLVAQRGASEISESPQTSSAEFTLKQRFTLDDSGSYQVPYRQVRYRELVTHIRDIVKAVVPDGVIVAVVSKGDQELLKLGGERRGWHFPQDDSGNYVGYHPADSSEALAHLEQLRTRGAEYWLLPGTSFWWLEHYDQFRDHMNSRYRRLWGDEACLIYQLSNAQSFKAGSSE
jgi:hypothetical protein